MDAAPPQLLVDDPRATPAQSLDMDTQRFNGFGATGLASPASNQTTHGSNYTDSTSNLAFSGQDDLTGLYTTSTSDGSFPVPVTNPSAAPTLLGSNTANGPTGPGNDPFQPPRNMFEGSLDPVPYTPAHLMSFGNDWQRLPATDFQRRWSTASRGTMAYPFAPNGQAQRPYATQAQMLQSLGPQAMMPQYQFMSQNPMNFPTQTNIQNAPGMGVSHGFAPSTGPGPSQHQQANTPPGTNQRRRHSRRSSLTGNTPSTTGSNSRGGGRGSRRGRGSDTTVSQASGRVPAYQQGTQTGTSTQPNEPTVPPREFYQAISMQQRVEAARRLNFESERLGEMLQRIRADDARALAYEENILRRYHNGIESLVPSSPPKGLDNQNDGRPEPKETEELTVNLECRICMSQVVDTVLLPCGHAILCRWCAEQHMSNRADRPYHKTRATCPMCRTPVKQKYRLFFS